MLVSKLASDHVTRLRRSVSVKWLLGNNHRGDTECDHSVLSESPIETCHLYQWGSVSARWYFGTDPRHYRRREVPAIKYRMQGTMKATRTQNLLAAAPIGTPALTTTHVQTKPKTKITTKIRDRKSKL